MNTFQYKTSLLTDITGIYDLDKIIDSYKEDLEINEKYKKCMNELKELNKDITYTFKIKSTADNNSYYEEFECINHDTGYEYSIVDTGYERACEKVNNNTAMYHTRFYCGLNTEDLDIGNVSEPLYRF